MWPVPEGKGIRVQGREKWVWAKWRGVEKCSVGMVREWGLFGGVGVVAGGGGPESGEGGNSGREGAGRGTGDVAYAEGRHGGYYEVGGFAN